MKIPQNNKGVVAAAAQIGGGETDFSSVIGRAGNNARHYSLFFYFATTLLAILYMHVPCHVGKL